MKATEFEIFKAQFTKSLQREFMTPYRHSISHMWFVVGYITSSAGKEQEESYTESQLKEIFGIFKELDEKSEMNLIH